MKRVRVEGDRFHPRVPARAVYVGRQAPYLKRSPFANPFRVEDYGQDEAVRLFSDYFYADPMLLELARQLIGDRDVACKCPLDKPCHGDVLVAALLAASEPTGHLDPSEVSG